MINFHAMCSPPGGAALRLALRPWMALLVLLLTAAPMTAGTAPTMSFGPPDGQGVFDVYATIPPGHGEGYFELSLDSGFRLKVSTLAGTELQSGLINSTVSSAKFNNPAGLARDSQGNVFVADSGNHCIRMISADGVVSTIAGSADYGFRDGPGAIARFAFPSAVALGPDGNLYVSDTNNTAIRKLTRPAVDGAGWSVTTLAGTNSAGFFDGSGGAARFSSPQGLALDADGNVYVADAGNHRIRRITPLGSVSTYAGGGSSGYVDGAATSAARFNSPYAVAVASDGTVFVADRLNHCIRRISTGGTVSTYAGTTVAGGADGALLGASFNEPSALAIDEFDVLYVADDAGQRIRRVTPSSGPNTVTTVAGTGLAGLVNGFGDVARFNHPAGLCVLASGEVLVADSENHCLRRISATLKVDASALGSSTSVGATIDPPALGIEPGTWYFRWRASDWTVVNIGLSKFITTVVPAVSMSAANPVNAGEATLKALVNPRNLAVTAVKFQYSTDPEFASPIEVNATPLPPSGGSDVEISFELSYPTETVAGTVYYYRAIAINDYGTATAAELASFTVPAATVVTDAASQVVRTGLREHQATLNATVDAKGSALNMSFEYSTQPDLRDAWRVSRVVDSPAATAARGVAVGLGGEVYFSRRDLHRLDALIGGAMVGSGVAGFADGSGLNARFDHPAGIAHFSPSPGVELLFVADEYNHRIRVVNLTTRTVDTLAGSGIAGFADGLAGTARFLYPTGVAVDSAGNVFVADTGNHRIRRIAAGTGEVSTVAGSGLAGLRDGAAASAQFSSPAALVCGPAGSILVADTGNHRIARISAALEVSTLAGSGVAGFADDNDADPLTQAQFSSPSGLVLDSLGNLFVADTGNHRVRRIASDGVVSTIAGSGQAGAVDSPLPGEGMIPASATSFSQPSAIAITGSDVLYVADNGNASLRKVEPMSSVTLTYNPVLSSHGNVSIQINTEVLSPGTTYYYRAIGDNRMDGVIRGDIRSFTTFTEPAIVIHDGANSSAATLAHAQATAVNFGVVALQTTVTRQFTISNTGGWALTLGSITVPSGYVLTALTTPIPAGESRSFSVSLTAATAGVYAGNLRIESDDPDRLAFEAALTGKKVEPPIIQSVTVHDLALAPTTATLRASVDPNGAETTVEFEVSPGPDFDGVRVSTLAGNGVGDSDGPLASAQFAGVRAIAVAADGSTYLADAGNHRIRRISPSGEVSTLAGSGSAGFADGPGASAQFNSPSGIAVGTDATVYVADTGNHRIRAIDATGTVRTFAGTGLPSFTDGIATAARFFNPMGMAWDASGNLLVADHGNDRVRRIAADGSVATAVQLLPTSGPVAVATTSSGGLYVSSPSEGKVWRVDESGAVVDTLPIPGAPIGLAYDEAAQELYVADEQAHVVWKVDDSSTVSAWAGSGTAGSLDGLSAAARFDEPVALALQARRTVLVAQNGGASLRRILPTVIKVPVPATLQDLVETVSAEVSGMDPAVVHYYRAIATSVGGRTVLLATLPLGTEFTQWQVTHFGPNAANGSIAGPSANPAGDGISNLMKYALGLDPAAFIQPDDPRLPVLGLEQGVGGAFLTLTARTDPAAPDVQLVFECSNDKQTWTTNGVNVSPQPDNSIKGSLPCAQPTLPNTARFLRMGVVLQLP